MVLIIYKILYEFIYSYGVSPLFSYMQLIYKPNLQKMVLSYVLFFLLIVILPQNVKMYLNILYQFFYFYSDTVAIVLLAGRSSYNIYIILCDSFYCVSWS